MTSTQDDYSKPPTSELPVVEAVNPQSSAGENSCGDPEQPGCYNCGFAKPKADAFCRNCGQKHTNLIDGVFHFVAEYLTQLLSLDGRAFSTLGNLLGRPGRLTNEFMQGRRKRYLPPVQIYLFSTFLFFFAFGSWAQPDKGSPLAINGPLRDVVAKPGEDSADREVSDIEESSGPETKALETGVSAEAETTTDEVAAVKTGDPADTEQAEKVEGAESEEPEAIRVVMFGSEMDIDEDDFRNMARMTDDELQAFLQARKVQASPWMVTLLRNSSRLTTDLGVKNYYATLVAIASQVAFVMLPLLAFSLRIMFFRSGKSLLQSFVLSSHLHAFTNLLLTPLLLLRVSVIWVLLAGLIFGCVHGYAALRRVYGESRFWTVLKMGIILCGYWFVMILGVSFISAAALFLYE